MADTAPPICVKMIVAILWSDEASREVATREMQKLWGNIDYEGDDHLFDVTDYYQSEMGSPLYRRLVSFEKLIQPDRLAELKLKTNEMESRYRSSAGRLVNLDIGYLDHNKLVLASAKAAGQKIYVGQGIYADLIARFGRGAYQPFEWTFIDFKDGRYNQDLNRIREIYLLQIKKTKF